jgi:hypothetical protein
MDKYQVRSCISGSGSITYDPLTGVIGGSGGGGATWGSITGTLSSQTDLQNALDLKQNESIVINSNTTAVLDGVYTVVASATFTDPTPAEGKGFMVFVRNGTATVGGTGYSTAGTVINRIYHSGAWANYTSSSFTPSALTKTDDTNVTLTLGGTPSTALLQAASLTLGWSGQLAISRGGTGGGLYAGWDLISTAVASSSATIDFTGLNNTYTTYKIVVSNLVPATNNTILGLRVGTGGTPTYQSGASDYSWVRLFSVPASSGGGGVNTDNKILIGSNGAQSNLASRGYSAEITIANPSQTTDNHGVYYTSGSIDSSGLAIYQTGWGVYLSTTAVTAIRIFMNSGNIASGTFKLYGIR